MRSLLRLLIAVALAAGGCASPEDGRARGGGPGASGGNVPASGVPVPSKIDGSRELPAGMRGS
jgi:hypothetical protein